MKKPISVPINDYTVVKRGEIHPALQGHLYSIMVVQFYRKEGQNCLITGSWDGTVKLFDIENGKQLDVLMVFDDPVEKLTLSPDEKWLLVSAAEKIYILDMQTRQLYQISPEYPLRPIANFTWDSKYVAIATFEDSVKIFSLSPFGEEVKVVPLPATLGGNNAIAFSRDDKLLITGQMNEEITFIQWQSPKFQQEALESEAHGHHGAITAIYVNANGYLVTGGNEGAIKIWDPNQKKILTTLHCKGPLLSVAFSALGQVVGGAAEKDTKIVSLTTGTSISLDHSLTASTIAISNDGKYAARGMGENKVVIWDTSTGKVYREIIGHVETVNDCVLDEEGKMFISASVDKHVHIMDQEGSDVHLLKAHTESVRCVDIKGSNILSAGLDDKLIIWDMKTWNKVKELKNRYTEALSVLRVIKEYILVAGGDFVIRELDYSGTVLNKFEGHEDFINDLAISPDNNLLASGSEDKTALLFDLKKGLSKAIKKYEFEDAVVSVAIDYTGTRLALGVGSKLVLVDLESKEIFHEVDLQQGTVNSIHFAPTHEFLIFATHRIVNLLDLSNLETAPVIIGTHLDKIIKVEFFPAGDRFFSTSFDKETYVYQFAEAGKEEKAPEVEQAVTPAEEDYTTKVETVDTKALMGSIKGLNLADTGYYEVSTAKEPIVKAASPVESVAAATPIPSPQPTVEEEIATTLPSEAKDVRSLINSVLEEERSTVETKVAEENEYKRRMERKSTLKREYTVMETSLKNLEQFIKEDTEGKDIFTSLRNVLDKFRKYLEK